MAEITGPGLYPDVPEAEYHADPVPGGSLSSSGARAILACPARFRWEQDNPPASKSTYDIGSAAHKLVLGVGPDICPIDADDWRTKAAKEARAAAYTAGQIPVLAREHEMVQAMAEALRRHPVASALLDPTSGAGEQTLVWQDPRSGVSCRARLDWLRDFAGIADYKTSVSAAPTAFAKSVARYGYHQQAPFYIDGLVALGLGDPDTQFRFIVQEKTPPYLVAVYTLDAAALRRGRELNHRARLAYQRYMAADEWPGYGDEITELSLPAWATNEDLYHDEGDLL